jgi:hypothetical protein
MGRYTLHFTTQLKDYLNITKEVIFEVYVFAPCNYKPFCFPNGNSTVCGIWSGRMTYLNLNKGASALTIGPNFQYLMFNEFACVKNIDNTERDAVDCLACGRRSIYTELCNKTKFNYLSDHY